MAFSQDRNRNGWFNFGASWGNQFETSDDSRIKTYMGSFGIDFVSYDFKYDKNIGYFTYASLFFPRTSTLEANGIKVTVDLSNYGFIFGLDEIIGFGFKKNLSETILLNFGIGPDIGLLFATSESSRQLSFFLGIGGAFGVKLGITDIISITDPAILHCI
jgi:hypothetical protein